MLKVVSIALFLSLCSSACLAQCPTFSTVSNLNLANQIGTWQIQGILRNPTPIGTIECLQATLTGSNLGVAPVNISIHAHGTDVDNNGDMIMIDATAIVTTLSRPGRWDVTYNNIPFVGSVIYTDYVQYSLFALCNPTAADGSPLLQVLFLSRAHDTMPSNIVDGFKNTLTNEYGVDTTNYKSIFHDHSTCGH